MNKESEERLRSLLLKAQAGDGPSYEAFLKESSAELRRFISKRVTNTEKCEEVLQEILISVHRARHTYLSDRLLSPWLYAIAKYRLADFFRSTIESSSFEIAMEELPEVAIALEITSERSAQIEVALAKLPQKQKEVITLLKLEGLSTKDVARRTGMTESAVKVTAHRGYKEIRRSLGVSDDEN